MNSEEINKLGFLTAGGDLAFWLKEIAYQLAVLVEQAAPIVKEVNEGRKREEEGR